jgi:hypothetical protein
MKTTWKWRRLVIAGGVALLVGAGTALAQGGFEVVWGTQDGGGAMASCGGGFEVSGTVGQPDAGVATGGTFAVRGGFWPGLRRGEIFTDGFETGDTTRWSGAVGGARLLADRTEGDDENGRAASRGGRS